MRHYETIYIINPELSDEDTMIVIDKFNGLIEKQNGVVIKAEQWGRQRMAYVVKKQHNGFYVLVEYCAHPGVTAELARGLKMDDRILLSQTVKLADNVNPEELKQQSEPQGGNNEEQDQPSPEMPENEAEKDVDSEGSDDISK